MLSSVEICISENKSKGYGQVLVTVIPKHVLVLETAA